MKIIDRFILIIFSIVIFILSVFTAGIVFGWIDFTNLTPILENAFSTEPTSNIILGVSIVFILFALKAIFFGGKDERATKDGILMENDNGRLLISKETLENLVINIVKGFEGTENAVSKVVLDKENNLRVFVTLYVHPNVVIKDLTANIQNRIKEAIKKTSDLETTAVNVKVRNIAPPSENNVKIEG